MNRKITIIATRLVLLGTFITGCSASARTTSQPNAALDPSVHDQLITLNAPADDWQIDIWCWYGADHFWAQIYPPNITESVELACTYETESGSGTCTYLRELNRFDTDRIPNGTPELTVTITGTSDPEPLIHTFVIEDVYPATCEDDPTGWVMGPRCQPDGLLTVSFAYPDIYEATACNILDASGTSYGCTIQPDERFSSLCVCEGLPVVGQHLRREIILADGTQVYGPWKFNGIDEHWCTFGEEPTPGVQESQPPSIQTCEDQQNYDACKAFGGCTWWSSGGCYSYPEPVFDCHQYDGNYDKCKAASACTWDDPKQTCNP